MNNYLLLLSLDGFNEILSIFLCVLWGIWKIIRNYVYDCFDLLLCWSANGATI